MSKKILVVDDEPKIRRILRQALTREGFSILEAANAKEALDIFSAKEPDLIILDIMMPQIDGFEVTKEIRKFHETPLIIISAKDDLVDKAIAFTLGVDDYITKPFNIEELTMRVKALLRRTQVAKKEKKTSLKIGAIEANFSSHILTVRGMPVKVTPREFALLKILMQHAGQVLSREQLLGMFDDGNYFADLNTINVFIRRLRKKIEDDPSEPRYLLTVWGVGYKFVTEK